jgi:hypothetical protein
MKKFAILLMALSFLILAGCGGKEDRNHEHAVGDQNKLHNGDLQEITASNQVMPEFLKEQDERIQQIYMAAAQHSDLLKWIPCYCGCADSAGHKSNMQCFYKEIRKDGSIVWDDHGTRCGTCLEIAAISIVKKQEGASTLEIRKFIDEKYGNGNYAKPTPTPMPQS